ncbi:Cullin-3 [Ceratobasidium sp. 370]|nr:Cullin-3 [Ceratobasidium sp. 370]
MSAGAHEQAWDKLSSAIQQIYAKNASTLSFEENYRHAYNLVVSKHGEMLYQGLTALVTQNLNRLAKEKLVPEFPRATLDGRDTVEMCQEGEAFVKAFRDVWDDHESSMSKISDLVKYMDRVYTDSARVPKIMDRGLELFLSEIVRSTQAPIRTQLVSTILRLVRMERDGTTINRSAMKQCIDVLLTLRDTTVKVTAESTVYKMYLESEILAESEAYYKNRGKEMVEAHDLAEYVRSVEVYINSEQDRTHSYLSFHTSAPLQHILDLYDRLLKNAWGGEVSLQTAINEAFESFVNQNKRASEFISLFIDDHLKKGMKGKTEDEVDILIDRTISVFRFVSDKDVFERYYKAHLAKRLLQSRVIDDEAERGMLGKLKVECGFAFTQKLEGMFHDIRLSSELTESFRAFVQRMADDDEAATSIDMHTSVLTSTFWPITHTTSLGDCIMPPVIAKSIANFERFYYARHTGRRLAWQPGYGSADIKIAFKARKHELNVSTLAMVVLLAFSDTEVGEELDYQEIKTATGIPDQELQRHLQSLACAKYKILRKHPASRNVSPTDTFSFNYEFTAPLQRIKIQTVASKAEVTDERRDTEEKVEEERKLQTEACIVRVMKDRKRMAHNDLIAEVTKQLSERFHPAPAAIKKRIEALIEKEYLERGEDKKSYNYLA